MKHGNKRRRPDAISLPCLATWPAPPRTFTAGERSAWKRIGEAAMVTGSVSGADLVLAERLAQLHARVDAALVDPDVKPASLVALVRLEGDMLGRMGLSPQGRNTVGPLRRPAPERSKLDEF